MTRTWPKSFLSSARAVPLALEEVPKAFFIHGKIFLRDQSSTWENSFDEITGVTYESINVILNHLNVRERERFDTAGSLRAILRNEINDRRTKDNVGTSAIKTERCLI